MKDPRKTIAAVAVAWRQAEEGSETRELLQELGRELRRGLFPSTDPIRTIRVFVAQKVNAPPIELRADVNVRALLAAAVCDKAQTIGGEPTKGFVLEVIDEATGTALSGSTLGALDPDTFHETPVLEIPGVLGGPEEVTLDLETGDAQWQQIRPGLLDRFGFRGGDA